MNRFEEIVPQLIPFEAAGYGKTRVVLKNPVEGTYFIVSKAQSELILGIDGTKTVSEYLSEHYHFYHEENQGKAAAGEPPAGQDLNGPSTNGEPGRVKSPNSDSLAGGPNGFSIKSFYNIIIELYLRGFLSEKNEFDLNHLSREIPDLEVGSRSLSHRLGGVLDLLIRFPFVSQMEKFQPVFRWIFNPIVVLVFIAFSALSLFTIPIGVSENLLKGDWIVNGKIVPMGYRWFLLSVLGSGILLMSFQNLVKMITMIKMGREIRGAGLRFRFGVPHFFVDTRDIVMAGPASEIFMALLNVMAALFVGTCFNYLQRIGYSGTFLSVGSLCALAVACWGLRPFRGNPLNTAIHQILPIPHLKDHSHFYLKKRFLKSLFSWRPHFEGERAMIIYGSYFFAWNYFAFYWVGELSRNNLPILFADIESGNLWAMAVSLVAVVGAGSMLFSMVKIIFQNGFHTTRVLIQKFFRSMAGKFKAVQGEEAVYESVAACPIFSGLAKEEVTEICGKMRFENYPAKTEIIVQGEKGDRFFMVLHGKVEVLAEENSGMETQLAVLGKGDSFGEIALLENVPRNATVRAMTAVQVVSLNKKLFQEFTEKTVEAGENITQLIRVGQFLKNIPLFRDLPTEQITRLIKKLGTQSHRAGETIIKKGEKGDHFFMVKSGELEVFKKLEDSPVATLREWDSFGEIALLNDIPRTATVRTVNPTELYVLNKKDFLETINQNIYAGIYLEEISLNRLAALKRGAGRHAA